MLSGPVGVFKYQRPWGEFERYDHNPPCTLKIITVFSTGMLSRQYHRHRDKLWIVLDNGARVELGEEVLEPEVGKKVFIQRRAVHRLSAVGERPVRVLEISFDQFDEQDIVRLEDACGRATAKQTHTEVRGVDGRLRHVIGI